MDQPDFQSIAAQLRNPKGEDGIKTAVRMSENNAFMIASCIDSLDLKPEEKVLEIGPGGGLHLPYLFQKENSVRYSGVDISETMIEMASENNPSLIETGSVKLQLVTNNNGYAVLPFEDNYFDKIFTVNTIYFWDNALEQARELYRALNTTGQIAVCFATADFMEQLPFTKYGFHLYSLEKAIQLFENAGFKDIKTIRQKEWIENTVNGNIERIFTIISCRKDGHYNPETRSL
ncbi:class I SAM-dependent methyltransferase [Taibaiella lutea]|uniref:Class I SAM-dependent methyltransferase n=1 Tax=Taibaiella lutea TaxID=2608001 RepID=A0A5M6CE55_9BACT|nr:class I SAM-dependent methyltransferase [Taibaiella lutea]KAA5532142.1 class I SAM-dependent methyltransferase [Taibaiella lutea]